MHNANFYKPLFGLIEQYYQEEKESPQRPPVAKNTIVEDFDLALQNHAINDDDFWASLQKIATFTPKTGGRGFYNQLFAGHNQPAIAADMLSALFNSSIYTYKIGGVHIAIEKEILKFLQHIAGFANGSACMTPGGSVGNMIAMMMARNAIIGDTIDDGCPHNNFTAYVSASAHYCFKKGAIFLGVGKNNMRYIPTHDDGKMDCNKLEDAIAQDIKNGKTPFFVAATAGTTVLGAYDDFHAIHAIAQRYNIWMHVDGAYGASSLLSHKHQHLMDGAQKANSLVWDAHKMLNIPLIASILMVQDATHLWRNFNMGDAGNYLFQEDDEGHWNPGEYSLQCGRRNDGFKLWAAFKYFGVDGIKNRISHLFDLANQAVQIINNNPNLILYQQPHATSVCFNYKGVDAKDLCQVLYEKGLLWVGYGSHNDDEFVRMSVVNAEFTTQDIDYFFNTLCETAQNI